MPDSYSNPSVHNASLQMTVTDVVVYYACLHITPLQNNLSTEKNHKAQKIKTDHNCVPVN